MRALYARPRIHFLSSNPKQTRQPLPFIPDYSYLCIFKSCPTQFCTKLKINHVLQQLAPVLQMNTSMGPPVAVCASLFCSSCLCLSLGTKQKELGRVTSTQKVTLLAFNLCSWLLIASSLCSKSLALLEQGKVKASGTEQGNGMHSLTNEKTTWIVPLHERTQWDLPLGFAVEPEDVRNSATEQSERHGLCH